MTTKLINRQPQYKDIHPLTPRIPVLVSETKSDSMEAIVVDVITNEDHQDYSPDGYNVGCIKFRLLNSDHFRPAGKLNWAFPDDNSITEYPLKNEIVKIIPLLNRFFYTKKVNVGKSMSNQALYGVEKEMQTIPSNTKKIQRFEQSRAIPENTTATDDELGKYFVKKPVFKLRHWEGDMVFEGRTGQSIRFGSSWTNQKIHLGKNQSLTEDQLPTIIMRVGAWKDAPRTINNDYGRVFEDINKDSTSLWMVEDQVVLLEPATIKDTSHKKSIRNYPNQFAGKQLIANSGRILLNSRDEKIMMFSKKGTHFCTSEDFSVDAERDYYSYIGNDRLVEIIGNNIQTIENNQDFWVGGSKTTSTRSSYTITTGDKISISSRASVNIIAPKIYLGTGSSQSEPLVLGETLRQLLIDFINAHLQTASSHVITPMGPGNLNPAIVGKLRNLLGQLQSKNILSRDNFVTKTNDSPRQVPPKVTLH